MIGRTQVRSGHRLRGTASALIFFILCFLPTALSAKAPTNADCLACHSDPGLTTEVNGKPVSLYVDEAKFKASIHGSMFACVDCHDDVKSAPHTATPVKISCAKCHSDEEKAYQSSVHGKGAHSPKAEVAKEVPTCTSCHGDVHQVLPASDPNSPVSHTNIPATCSKCHATPMVLQGTGLSAQPALSYKESVHGKAVAGGSQTAAVCTDCHGSHAILTPRDSKSSIAKFNVPNTCGKCHGTIEKEYNQSIHGKAIAAGNWAAPVCTDCHGIHTILQPTDPKSSVSGQALARTTCARCHEGVRLSEEFGVPGDRIRSYMDSYHGLASQLGSQVVANCASCHGVHNILPSSDPNSTINKAHLVQTCGKCHPGASANFVKSKVHIDVPLSRDPGSIAIRWIRWFYLSMIIGTIGAMLFHNFLVWRKKALALRRASHRPVVRMNPWQRAQHLTLLISFITLVLTGFALKYPETWLGWVFNESIRRWVHRVAGVVLIGVGLFHVFYIAFRKDGRKMVKDMLPILKDATDVVAALKYYLGLSDQRPQFLRFNYGEKFEYWALVWGTFVMAATGLLVWFQVQFSAFVPRWIIDVALAIHFYEAILATLAIIVWHFYAVIFDPDVYPMNWAWLDGRMSVHHYEVEHPLALADAEFASTSEGSESEEDATVKRAQHKEEGPPADKGD
jgi:formate dehydrogenase gamma subunit